MGPGRGTRASHTDSLTTSPRRLVGVRSRALEPRALADMTPEEGKQFAVASESL